MPRHQTMGSFERVKSICSHLAARVLKRRYTVGNGFFDRFDGRAIDIFNKVLDKSLFFQKELSASLRSLWMSSVYTGPTATLTMAKTTGKGVRACGSCKMKGHKPMSPPNMAERRLGATSSGDCSLAIVEEQACGNREIGKGEIKSLSFVDDGVDFGKEGKQ